MRFGYFRQSDGRTKDNHDRSFSYYQEQMKAARDGNLNKLYEDREPIRRLSQEGVPV